VKTRKNIGAGHDFVHQESIGSSVMVYIAAISCEWLVVLPSCWKTCQEKICYCEREGKLLWLKI